MSCLLLSTLSKKSTARTRGFAGLSAKRDASAANLARDFRFAFHSKLRKTSKPAAG